MGSDPRVDAFLATLRDEQARFLQAIGHARSLLGSESGQLAHVTAIQGRLTRQFFDAQRGLMMHRAEVDAQVATIAAEATEHSAALVEDAKARVAAGLIPPAREVRCSDPISQQVPIVSLGISVVNNMQEAEVLASVIDEAFESREPDGAVAERQLAEILDEWWAAELQEGVAVVDDATARAAVRRHIGAIEAEEVFEVARRERHSGQQPVSEPALVLPEALEVKPRPVAHLPNRVLDLTTNADTSDLAGLFAELAASLADPTPIPARPTLALVPPLESDRTVIDPAEKLQLNSAEPNDPFRTFWEQGPFPNAPKGRSERW